MAAPTMAIGRMKRRIPRRADRRASAGHARSSATIGARTRDRTRRFRCAPLGAGRPSRSPPDMISTGELKKGVAIELDGELWQILDYHHIKMGRGSAQVRITLRNIK